MTEGKLLRHEPCRSCPSSDALAIYEDGHGYCFSCSTYFTPADLGESDEQEVEQKAKPHKAEGLIREITYTFLSARKISEETCKRYGYGVGVFFGQPCQIAPYYRDGREVAQHIRLGNPKDFRWLGDSSDVEFFGQHLFKNGGKRLIVTEGEIDCLTVSQVQGNRWPVVSIPSGVKSAKKTFKKHLEWLESYQEVVLCFDNDEPGREAIEQCAPLLTPGKCKVVNLPKQYKDPNDMLLAGKMDQLVSALWDAKVYRPDGILAGTDIRDRMLNRFSQGVVRGFDIPYPGLDEMLYGVHKGKLLTLTAGSGIGKSTLAHEIAYCLNILHKQSVAIVALEENVEQSSMKQMGINLNKPLHLDMEGVTERHWAAAFDQTIGNGRTYLYDHFGSLESDNLLSKCRYLAVSCGVDFILLDHVSIVVSGGLESDERKAIDALMTNLRSLVENTGVGVIVISHLKRAEGKAKSHEEGGRVTLGQLRGSGAIAQLSDFVVGLERDQQGNNPDVTTIRVLKNRHTGRLGIAGYLKYHHDTGRLLDFTPEEGTGGESDDF